MKSFFLLVFPYFWASVSAFHILNNHVSSPTLRLVHVLFRHGDRNPEESGILKTSKYSNESYYPEGFGQLTNAGKRTEYRLGKELRNRYDAFLTKTWRINYLDPRSTNVNRTKMSLELMLASLYLPLGEQMWSPLLWQPIPINYYEAQVDKEILPFTACKKRYDEIYGSVVNSTEMTTYKKERYKRVFKILDRYTGETNDFEKAWGYYIGFRVQQELGHELEAWTKPIYPGALRDIAIDNYYLMTNNTSLRRIMAGYLLKKILTDTASKISGTINPSERKMFIYSAHEMNVAAMLLSLEVYHLADVPPYGSYILFELHEIDGVWGIKLFYQNYKHKDPIPLTLPGCEEFCPFEEFYNLVEEILPTDDTDCYGSKQ